MAQNGPLNILNSCLTIDFVAHGALIAEGEQINWNSKARRERKDEYSKNPPDFQHIYQELGSNSSIALRLVCGQKL